MKKILCSVLCLTLLLTFLPFPAEAVSPSLSIECDSSYSAGETFTVNILASDLTGCCGVGFRLQYDDSMLEIVSAKQGSAFAGGQMVENLYYADDQVAITLTGSAEQNLSGIIATVTFMAKSDVQGTAVFTILSPTAVSSDSSSISLTSGNASTAITAMPDALLTIVPEPGAGGNLLIHVDLTDASYYCALTFCLNYDNSRYEIASAERGAEFAAATGFINTEYADDQVFISTLYAQAVSQNGRLLTVTLKSLPGNKEAEGFSIDILEYVDSSFMPLEIDWTFAPGMLANLTESSKTISTSASFVNLDTEGLTCTVMLALYTENGQLLQTSIDVQAVSAGGAATFDLSVPSAIDGAYVQLFFLNGSMQPICPAVQQSLSN